MTDPDPSVTADRAVFDATAGDYDRGRKRVVPACDVFYAAALS